MNRQEYWKSKGYTDENIQNHLKFERRKSKESRERKKRNNLENKDVIKKIKEDLLGKTFVRKVGVGSKYISTKILSINPTVDGVGFWYKINKTFSDNSSGDFRYFYDFYNYNKEEFIKQLSY
jgi:hypothetical protein